MASTRFFDLEIKARNLWSGAFVYADSRERSRAKLVLYLKFIAELTAYLPNEDLVGRARGKRRSFGTGEDIALQTLSVMSLSSWINEHDEPVLYRMFWIIAKMVGNLPTADDWGEFSVLAEQLV